MSLQPNVSRFGSGAAVARAGSFGDFLGSPLSRFQPPMRVSTYEINEMTERIESLLARRDGQRFADAMRTASEFADLDHHENAEHASHESHDSSASHEEGHEGMRLIRSLGAVQDFLRQREQLLAEFRELEDRHKSMNLDMGPPTTSSGGFLPERMRDTVAAREKDLAVERAAWKKLQDEIKSLDDRAAGITEMSEAASLRVARALQMCISGAFGF